MNNTSIKRLTFFDLRWAARSVRHWKTIVVVLLLLVPVVVEAGYAVWVWLKVDEAAQFAVRYGITGSYDSAYCPAPCDSPAAQDAARLRSIYALVRKQLAQAVRSEDAVLNAVSITVCSNRPGYQYDAQSNLCTPHNDAGEDGSGNEILVSLTYGYPLGALWGAGFTAFPIQATRRGIVETFRSSRDVTLPADFGALSVEPSTTNPNVLPPTQERLVIISGEMQLIVTEVEASADQIANLAKNAGGYVVQSSVGHDSEQTVADITIRVPATQFETVIDQVKALGIQVLEERIVGQDVTEEYVDLEARLRGLQATATQLETLLTKAQTVDEALKVSLEQGKLQEQIEQVIGRKQYLENQVALATLSISLSTQQPRPVLAPLSWQPTVTFEKATRFLVAAGYFVGDVLIWGLIVGMPLVVVVGGITWGIKRIRRKAGS
jgi:hypothetical protein